MAPVYLVVAAMWPFSLRWLQWQCCLCWGCTWSCSRPGLVSKAHKEGAFVPGRDGMLKIMFFFSLWLSVNQTKYIYWNVDIEQASGGFDRNEDRFDPYSEQSPPDSSLLPRVSHLSRWSCAIPLRCSSCQFRCRKWSSSHRSWQCSSGALESTPWGIWLFRTFRTEQIRHVPNFCMAWPAWPAWV